MSAEAVEVAAPVVLTCAEARSLAAAVRALVLDAQGVTGGGRRLDAEEFAALRQATARLAAVVYSIDPTDAEIIDLGRERMLRRR
jgi:hypothetical protein